MGLIRKSLSISSAGAVKFTSERESRTKRNLAEARVMRAEAASIADQATPKRAATFADVRNAWKELKGENGHADA